MLGGLLRSLLRGPLHEQGMGGGLVQSAQPRTDGAELLGLLLALLAPGQVRFECRMFCRCQPAEQVGPEVDMLVHFSTPISARIPRNERRA